MNSAERAHLGRIKSMPCAVCGAYPPNDAHHILDTGRRIGHYATIPLCRPCHNNIGGPVWKVTKMNELKAWEQTIGRLYG